MGNESFFLSLRWKLAILFGSFFLILLTVFSYYAYLNEKANFETYRTSIHENHINILKALTKDSFTGLEQLAELVSLLNPPGRNTQNDLQAAVSSVDDRWSRWQLVWDIHNISFFGRNGELVKSWGETFPGADAGVKAVFNAEAPENRIICFDLCYEQVIVPLMGKSEIIGALSIISSYADVMIKYKNATQSDIGILNAGADGKNNALSLKARDSSYHLSAMTDLNGNSRLLDYISRHYHLEQFSNKGSRVEFENAIYEISTLPVQPFSSHQKPVIYLFVDNVTADIKQLNANLKQIWLSSVLGLLAILLFTGLSLHWMFRRISSLSKALPLLPAKKFDDFRRRIRPADTTALSYDEIDILNDTARLLSDQLEALEQNRHGQTFSFLEKTQELAKERDFVRQLIDFAPIIIIIQKLNGIILLINHTGKQALGTSGSVIGRVFDTFIPESDQEHLAKLNRLRSEQLPEQIEQDGQMLTETNKLKDITWLHKLLASDNEKVILTLGLDISERKIAEARNVRMAYFDYLTGLGNRRKFNEEFMRQIASAERYGYQLALLYLDLDRFKEINDTSGHEAGDNFLKLVADTLKGVIRSTDLLCRLGGDEFILLMPHADPYGVDYIANKLNSVLKTQVFTCSGKSFIPSASIGVSIYPTHGATVNELMANADLAMYRAKELGRGQYHLFDSDYDYRSRSNQMVHWRGILEEAIHQDKFILQYQPILNIRTNQINHFECLVRLQQSDGQIMMPSEFVFKAEELGLIGKIDRMVLKKALLQHIAFKRQGKNYKLSINVSRRSFEDPAILEDFKRLFDDPEVDRSNIIFEITDGAAVSNFQAISELITRIKGLGCVLALNDFGIEYPSLQYLKNAPVDYVKIDGSLIRQIDKNREDKAFVKALSEIAQAFGKKTVAEFVENENILIILKEFGIDYAQGYYIGWPASIDKNS